MKNDLLFQIAEREVNMNAMRDDVPGLAANLGVEMLPNEQNKDDCRRTTIFKDQERLTKG
jgi:hypothetical protein